MTKLKALSIVALVAIILSAGYRLWLSSGGGAGSAIQRADGSAEQAPVQSSMTIETVWSQASYFEQTSDESLSASRLSERLAESLSPSIEDLDQLLTDITRKLLLQSVAAHAAARTDPSPEAYLRLAESERGLYEWVKPGTDRWRRSGCEAAFNYYFNGEQPTSSESPETLFRRLWKVKVTDPDNQFVDVGVPPTGARIIIGMIRTPEQPNDLIFSEKRMRYWNGVTHRSFATRMRWPIRSREDALAKHGHLIIADCNMLVRTASDKLMNWRTLWFYDPIVRAWVCDQPIIASNNDASTMF